MWKAFLLIFILVQPFSLSAQKKGKPEPKKSSKLVTYDSVAIWTKYAIDSEKFQYSLADSTKTPQGLYEWKSYSKRELVPL